MKVTKESIAIKKAQAIKDNQDPLYKGSMIITQHNKRQQTKYRNDLEQRSVFNNKITRGRYASDAMASRFGIH